MSDHAFICDANFIRQETNTALEQKDLLFLEPYYGSEGCWVNKEQEKDENRSS